MAAWVIKHANVFGGITHNMGNYIQSFSTIIHLTVELAHRYHISFHQGMEFHNAQHYLLTCTKFVTSHLPFNPDVLKYIFNKKYNICLKLLLNIHKALILPWINYRRQAYSSAKKIDLLIKLFSEQFLVLTESHVFLEFSSHRNYHPYLYTCNCYIRNQFFRWFSQMMHYQKVLIRKQHKTSCNTLNSSFNTMGPPGSWHKYIITLLCWNK